MDTLCKIKDIYKLIMLFETEFQNKFDLSLNGGLLLCALKQNKIMTSGEVAANLGITLSNSSKIIALAEDKNLISREIGSNDKRQMCFKLTKQGEALIKNIYNHGAVFEKYFDEIITKVIPNAFSDSDNV